MISNSLRWRLPISYIGLAMFTTLVFGGLLLVTLRVYYSERERRYLSSNGNLFGQQLAFRLSNGASISSLEPQTSAYARALQTRIRVFDAADHLQLDSGSPQSTSLPDSDLQTFIPTPTFSPSASMPTPPPGQVIEEDISINIVAFAPGQPELAGRHSNQRVSLPLLHPQTGDVLGRLELSEGPAYGEQIISGVIQIGVWVSLGAISVAALVGWFISHRLTDPLLGLAEVTTRMASGDLSARATFQRTDEIGVLANSFNQMAARVQQTVTTLRNFTADAAHELHNPLTALLTNLDLAVDSAQADPETPLYQARVQATQLIEMTNDLLDLSRLETQNDSVHQILDLTAILYRVAEVYASRAEQAGIDFDLKLGETQAFIYGNNIQVRRAVGNVLDNAIKFTPAGETITVEMQKVDDWFQVNIIDTGLGVHPEDLPNIFNRFYRGRHTGAYVGSGLGLAVVKAIIESHQGYVSMKSREQGTVFTLCWPVSSEKTKKDD